ncbi:CopY/TcrY family copper transport repressor [Periweissella fabalis]|nr:CopY/TcrY family copper transport repressor [Periweissella fabalis]MCM0599262.1 CopY/TcrY family copper transport repressor [Periweissella fabalis]
MDVNGTEMTSAEWELMRIIWTKGQASSSEIINLIQLKKDWSESTVKTLLHRLVSKQYLQTTKDGRRFIYTPLIDEAPAVQQITSELFRQICAMEKGPLLLKLLEETTLSQADIAAMQAVLSLKLQTAPLKVHCDCLPDGSCNKCC